MESKKDDLVCEGPEDGGPKNGASVPEAGLFAGESDETGKDEEDRQALLNILDLIDSVSSLLLSSFGKSIMSYFIHLFLQPEEASYDSLVEITRRTFCAPTAYVALVRTN